MQKKEKTYLPYKPAVGFEGLITLAVLVIVFGGLAWKMGGQTLVKTMFALANYLLFDTCFYIMAIAVLAGALSAILTEFGVLALFNRILSPLMRPLYNLPGAAALGILTTFLSDNPAILTLCDDRRFRAIFKRYQLPALTNIGTAFGMGLIVCARMVSISGPKGESMALAVGCGLLGAIVGSIISTRLMLIRTRRYFGDKADEPAAVQENTSDLDMMRFRVVRPESVSRRIMDCLMEGGKSGVSVGFAIIPGVLVICTFVMILTNAPNHPQYPGIALIPWIGEKLNFILQPLFGFASSSCISVPLTALGSAGAAIGLVPDLVSGSLASQNDVAVFTAMCMCWSGYLSTHVAMMDALESRPLTGAAIISHTFGGLGAGIAAHWIYQLAVMFL